jgi:hypothetical protein
MSGRPTNDVQVSVDPRTNKDYAGSTLKSTFGTVQGSWKLGAARVDERAHRALERAVGVERALGRVESLLRGALEEDAGQAHVVTCVSGPRSKRAGRGA